MKLLLIREKNNQEGSNFYNLRIIFARATEGWKKNPDASWTKSNQTVSSSIIDHQSSIGKQFGEASVRLGHKSLRTLMKRSSSWYLPGDLSIFLSGPEAELQIPWERKICRQVPRTCHSLAKRYSRGKGMDLFIKVLGARTYLYIKSQVFGFSPKGRVRTQRPATGRWDLMCTSPNRLQGGL